MGRLITLCLILLWPSLAHAERLEPASTWAVVAGVLEWQDPGLASFPKQNRKDQELFEVLGAKGVPAAQRALLLDDNASANAVEAALEDIVKRAPSDATLVFYFAGHGVKDQSGRIIFTTADTRLDQLDKTGLHLSRLQRILDKFKGKRLILLADCCHSGGLVEVAKALSKKRGAMALTSSEASNVSTSNWTFTQTLIDGLRGRRIQDRDGDGAVELFEIVGEVKDAMKHRESQRFGFGNHGVTDELVFANVEASLAEKHDEVGAVKRRAWVLAPRDKGKQVARVLSVQGDRAHMARRRPARRDVAGTGLPREGDRGGRRVHAHHLPGLRIELGRMDRGLAGGWRGGRAQGETSQGRMERALVRRGRRVGKGRALLHQLRRVHLGVGRMRRKEADPVLSDPRPRRCAT